MLENSRFLEIMAMLGLLILPELNTSTSIPTTQHIVIVDTHVLRSETGSGCEERDDADANTNAECSGGVGGVDGMKIGDDGVVLVMVMIVVVERRGRRDDEEIPQTHHIRWCQAIIDGPRATGPHSGGGSGAGSSASRSGGSSIEAE